MLPHKAFGFSLYTQLSRSIAETMIDDEDNTTRKCTLKACVDMLQRGRSSECVCVVGLSPKIEVECMTGFHTCNHTVLTYYNSPSADPGSCAAVVPQPYYKHSASYWLSPFTHTQTQMLASKKKKNQTFLHVERQLWWIIDWSGRGCT